MRQTLNLSIIISANVALITFATRLTSKVAVAYLITIRILRRLQCGKTAFEFAHIIHASLVHT